MKTLKRPDPERLHVLAAKLRLLLLNICVWFAAWLNRKLPREMRIMLREDIREMLFGARLLIFLLAMTKRKRSPLRFCTDHPPSTPPGFRRNRHDIAPFRKLKRVVRLRGRTIHARLAALRDMFDNLGRWAARVLKHVIACRRTAALVLSFSRASQVRALSVVAPALADSS